MAENQRKGPQGPNNAEGFDPREMPSQAEGDRGTIEEDLQEKQSGRQEAWRPASTDGPVETTPSQAEGDRETIERDLQEKLGGQQ